MAHIDDNVLKVWRGGVEHCNILTTGCPIAIGDTIQVGCYAYWNGDPMQDGVEIWLRFQDYYGGSFQDVLIGLTRDGTGWCAANHTVTAADLDGLGSYGRVLLYSYSDPKAWSPSHYVTYAQPTPIPPPKEETDLTCQPSIAAEGNEIVIVANLKAYDGVTVYDLPDKVLTFDFGGATMTGTTDTDGNASVTIPAALAPSAGSYRYTAEFSEENEYLGDSCTGTVTVTEPRAESWKSVSEPYWDGKWVRIDYEMQNPDDTPFLPPDYPYRYFYRGEPWIGGACKTEDGSQMKKGGDLTGKVLFAGNVGDEVTLKLAKIDRDDVSVVDSYPYAVVAGTIPEPSEKEETDLTCHPSVAEEGSSVILKATLKDSGDVGLPGKIVTFDFNNKLLFSVTDDDGDVSVTYLASQVPAAGSYTYTAVFDVDDDYEGDTCTGTVTVTPEALPQLTVNSTPSGAKIYIQYSQTGEYIYAGYQTNITLGVPVGTHNVKVLKDGYEEPDPQTVTLAEGGSETISFTLTPTPPPITVIFSDFIPPTSILPDEMLKVPCTILNSGTTDTKVKVYLIATANGKILNTEPDTHWQDIDAGASFGFDDYLNTLSARAPSLIGPGTEWPLRIEVRQVATPDIVDDFKEFTVVFGEKPSWFDSLVSSIFGANVESISAPILDLFTSVDLEGFTIPPFKCIFCGANFSGETAYEDYATHLISHIKEFEEKWFE